MGGAVVGIKNNMQQSSSPKKFSWQYPNGATENLEMAHQNQNPQLNSIMLL